MREMERMMGGAPRRPLVSRLLDAERLSETERNALRGEAERRAQEGLQRLEEGQRNLETARRARDDDAIRRALDVIAEGIAQWQTGWTVQDALSSSGARPKEQALQWFKSRMNLEASPALPTGRPWGLSWVHLTLMAALVAFVLGAIATHAYKVRRSVALLDQLTRGQGQP